MKIQSTWSLPSTASLPELVRDRSVSVPLADNGRPSRQPRLVIAPKPGVAGVPDDWPERLDPSVVAAVSALQGRRIADKLAPAVPSTSLQRPAAYQAGLLAAVAGRQSTDRMAVVRNEYALQADGGWRQPIEDATDHDETQQAILFHCVEDVIRNVFHHAGGGAKGAHVAWRRHAGANGTRWQVAVADTGKGIVADIRENLQQNISAEEALELALTQSFSGSEQPGQNRGVGLYVVRSVALRIGGSMRIWGPIQTWTTLHNFGASDFQKGQSPYAEGKPSLLGLGARPAPPKMKKRLGQMLGELVRIWFSPRIWTGNLLFEATSKSIASSRGSIVAVPNAWPGTLVEFELRFDADRRHAHDLIHNVLSELEDPRTTERLPIVFLNEGRPKPDDVQGAAELLSLREGDHKTAVDRVAAARLGDDGAQRIRDGVVTTLRLDCSAVVTITDAYAYALLHALLPALQAGQALQVGAAKPQVRSALLVAARALRREEKRNPTSR